MAKNFAYLFISFFIITGSIIFWESNKEEDNKNHVFDKNIQAYSSRQVNKSVIPNNIKEKIKDEKQELLEKKINQIDKASKHIDELIAKTEKYIKDNNIVIHKQELSKDKEFTKIQDKMKKLRAEIESLE